MSFNHLQSLRANIFRVFLIAITLHFCQLPIRALDAAHRAIQIVQSGKANATIIVTKDASTDVRKAAAELADMIEKSTGVELPIASESSKGRIELHIGSTPYAQSLDEGTDDLKLDGFRILFPANDRIVLIGQNDKGTPYAVYDFLERYVGVRWLFPGELGTHIPAQDAIAIPVRDITSEPVFISRTISTMANAEPGEATGDWLRHQRNHWTIQHHHNIHRLFDPDKFYDAHPQFYPRRQGKPFRPAANSYDWNPRLDAEGIVEFAVDQISQYFQQNPAHTSYSLGINDTNEFDYPSTSINSVGLADYSDYYFRFANGVAEKLQKEYPDKWLGCLAYVGVTDPPKTVGVHPRIVPHVCIDRQSWASEEHAQRDMQRTREWHAAAPVLGWYDYIYGDDMYRIPRIYPHLMGRYIRFAAENGVQSYYAEYYGAPAWTEGPKMYVLMKLLWDPSTDVDTTLGEWYRLAVGEKAAVPLSKYYALWENYWVQRVTKTAWFRLNADKVYFDFDRIGYLDELTDEDLIAAQRLMNEVVALAETPVQKQRAAFLADGLRDIIRDVRYHVQLSERPVVKSAILRPIHDDTFAPTAAVDEAVPQPWGGWQNEPGEARFYWDHAHGHTDTHSLAIDAAKGGPGSAIFYRDFNDIDLKAIYHLKAMVQVTGVNENADIGLEIRWERIDGKYLPRKYTTNIFLTGADFNDGQWKEMAFFAQPPADVGTLKMKISLATVNARQGTIRFDDMSLVTVDAEKVLSTPTQSARP